MFNWRTDTATAKGRQEVAQLLDALRLTPLARAILKIIFSLLWPDDATAPLPLIQISVKQLEALTGYSKGSISPQLKHLKAEGWLNTSGKGDKYQINWSLLFEVDEPRPVQLIDDKIGPVQFSDDNKLDRSNSNRSKIGPIGPVHMNESVDELDRLDRFSPEIGPVQPENWTGPTGQVPPRDAFSLEELIQNAIEDSPTLQSVVEKLDRCLEKLDRLDRSNRSNSDATCMLCNANVHDMLCGDLEGSESSPAAETDEPSGTKDQGPRTKDQPTPESQEGKPMTVIARVTWPADLYGDEGLTREQLQLPSVRDRLWKHAVENYGWPAHGLGRVQFHATVFACLRRGKPPGRMLTSAVKEQRHGHLGWWSKADLRTAHQTTGYPDGSTVKPSASSSPAAASSRAAPPPRDWSVVDAKLRAASLDELTALMEKSVVRSRYLACLDAGQDPRTDKILIPELRRVVALTMSPREPVAAVAAVASHTSRELDTCGLNLEF